MDLSDKARDVVAEGTARRGEYDPEPGSVPYRLYQDYARRGGRVPTRENFCHFWRVVVIWAPLFWVRDHTVNTAPFKRFMKSGVGGTLKAVGRGIAFPFKFIDRKVGHDRLMNIGIITFMTLVVLYALGMLFLMGSSLAWWAPLVLVAGLAAVAVFIGYVIEPLIDKRQRRKQAERDAAWAKRWEAILNGTYEPEPEVVKQPGIVRRFFSGLWDLIVLLAQVIRVKKWKICPYVNIEVTR